MKFYLYNNSLLRSFYPNAMWEVQTAEKEVFLTFDDGPHPTITPWILDQLDLYNAKATFFCIGDNVRKYPEVYQEIIRRGHVVGNHTYNHLKGLRTSSEEYVKNVQLCAELVDSKLFRPPYGRMSPAQSKFINNQLQMKVVMWSLLSFDYSPNLNIKKTQVSLQNQTKSGSIVVFHDSEKAKANLQKLLLEYLNFLHLHQYSAKAIAI